MSCKPTYKGVRYNSLEELYNANGVNTQQAQQLYSAYLESLNKPNTNPILQGNQQEQVKKFAELQERLNNKEFIEGAKNAYESSKGLQEWGTQEQYNDYIARVSLGIVKNPTSGEYNYESQVKDIVYHGTTSKNKFDKFNSELNNFGGYYFTLNQSVASNYGSAGVITAVINSTNPLNVVDTSPDMPNHSKVTYEPFKDNNYDYVSYKTDFEKDRTYHESVVRDTEQIHILGSKQDIKGFKEFVTQPTTQSVKSGVSELFESNPKLANEVYEALGFGNLLSLEDILKEYTKNLFHTYLKNNPNGNITEFKLYIASIKKLIDEKGKILTKELIDLLNNKELWNTITKDSDFSDINISESLIVLLKNNPSLIDYLKENEDINEEKLYNKLKDIMLEGNIKMTGNTQESEKEKDIDKILRNKYSTLQLIDQLKNIVLRTKDQVLKNKEINIDKENTNIINFISSIMTKKEFQLSLIENEMYDTFHAILEHPANFKYLINPLNNKTLKNIRKNLSFLFEKDITGVRDWYRLLDILYEHAITEQNFTGKDVIGILAISSTFYIHSQMNNLKITTPYIINKIGSISFKTSTRINLNHNIDKDGNTLLGKLRDVENTINISDSIAEFLISGVDNPNDSILGVLNSGIDTINTILLLLRAGVDIYTVEYFINNPVIREYIRQRDVFSSLAYKNQGDPIYSFPLKESDKNKTIAELVAGKFGYPITDKFNKTFTSYLSNGSKRKYSKTELYNMMVDPESMSYEDIMNILTDFIRYESLAQELTQNHLAITYDTQGIGSTTNQTMLNISNTNYVMEKEVISNFRNILQSDHGFVRPYYNAAKTALDVFNPVILVNRYPKISETLGNVIDMMLKKERYTPNNIERFVTDYNNAFMTLILQSYYLLEYGDSFDNEFGKIFIKDNLANKILDFKRIRDSKTASGNEALLKPMLDKMYIFDYLQVINPNNLFPFYNFNINIDGINDNEMIDVIVDEINVMLNNPVIFKNLGKDLIFAIVMQYGYTYHRSGGYRLIPSNVYTEMLDRVYNYYGDQLDSEQTAKYIISAAHVIDPIGLNSNKIFPFLRKSSSSLFFTQSSNRISTDENIIRQFKEARKSIYSPIIKIYDKRGTKEFTNKDTVFYNRSRQNRYMLSLVYSPNRRMLLDMASYIDIDRKEIIYDDEATINYANNTYNKVITRLGYNQIIVSDGSENITDTISNLDGVSNLRGLVNNIFYMNNKNKDEDLFKKNIKDLFNFANNNKNYDIFLEYTIKNKDFIYPSGFNIDQIADMFIEVISEKPSNIILSEDFNNLINSKLNLESDNIKDDIDLECA